MERINRGTIQTVLEDKALLLTKVDLFVASGGVWED